MEFIADIYNAVPGFVWTLSSWASTACAILFIHFSSRYRNVKLPLLWYIFAFFMPLIAILVYFFRERRLHKKIEVKVCENCGKMYPTNFQYCSECLAELPEYQPEKKKQQKIFATVFLCLYVAIYLFNAVSSVHVISSGLEVLSSKDTAESRICLKDTDGADVYYDRNGERYYDELEVPLYDREGNTYYYTYAGGDCFHKDDGTVSLWEEDNDIYAEYCYVDEEGYFVDMSGKYDLVKIVETEDSEYYFETPYTDGEGNLYYPAMYASWNKQGQLITSEDKIY